jgi:hypothetical protein
MNLLQKLRPQYLKKLQQHADQEPQTVSEIIETLETEKYVGNLKYSTVIDLQCLLSTPTLNAYIFFRDDS